MQWGAGAATRRSTRPFPSLDWRSDTELSQFVCTAVVSLFEVRYMRAPWAHDQP
jgi:hypothetical protein